MGKNAPRRSIFVPHGVDLLLARARLRGLLGRAVERRGARLQQRGLLHLDPLGAEKDLVRRRDTRRLRPRRDRRAREHLGHLHVVRDQRSGDGGDPDVRAHILTSSVTLFIVRGGPDAIF